MLVASAKSNLGCEAGCGVTVSFSDHSRIGPALEVTFQQFSGNFCESFKSQFAWQAQYSVMLEDDTCCFAHCK